MGKKYKTANFWRVRARFLFRIFLTLGFIVQSVKFLERYLQYPSIVELEVVQPSELEMPAFTVCNRNEIRSSVYCKKYPEKCGNLDSFPNFCHRFAEYCKFGNITKQVPLHGLVQFRSLSRYEQQTFGQQFGSLVRACAIETDEVETSCTSTPILIPALSPSYEIPFNCYMMYSLHKKPHERPKIIPISTKIHLDLNLEVPEYNPMHLSRGAQLSIHSPYHVPSLVGEGLFLNMGTVNRIYVKLAEKLLLPPPYKSNCTSYDRKWKQNGGTGPVTEKMCKEKCKLEKSLSLYGCAERRIDYPHNETLCLPPIVNFAKETRAECAKNCPPPCRMRKYELQVQEVKREGSEKSCEFTNDPSCATVVHISFENLEVTTFTYFPRFEAIGVLSFIGGYVGLWLGISFLNIYDFLDTKIFRLISILKQKWKISREKNRVSEMAVHVFTKRKNSPTQSVSSKESKQKYGAAKSQGEHLVS